MSDRYVVAGNPVAHSRSPQIHTRFAQQTGQDLEYRRLPLEENEFEQRVAAFFAGGGAGMNITVPFKQRAFALLDEPTERARVAGAANTLMRDTAGRLLGDNTDGAGLVRDLRHNLGWAIRARSVLLLGAGGAARGVLGPLLAEQPQRLVIVNRDQGKAVRLAGEFCAAGAVASAMADIRQPFDLVINATSASLSGVLPGLPSCALAADSYCYDLAYGDKPTAFLDWARECGVAATADGLGMLVEQAAEAFAWWRGVRPDTAPVLSELRTPVRIRQASSAADMTRAGELFREYQHWLDVDLCFQGFEQELASLPGAYAEPDGALLLAQRGAEIIGCVALRPVAEGVCEMKRLYVPAAGRGAGLGRELAVAVIAAGRRAGYHTMRLDTLERLREAMNLYQSLGFLRCAPYYHNPLGEVAFWELDLRVEGEQSQ